MTIDYDPILGLTSGEDSSADKEAPQGSENPVQQLLDRADAHRAPDVTDFDAAYAAYAEALDKEPANVRAMEGLINVGVRGGRDWAELWHRAKAFEKNRRKDKQPVRRPLREALNAFFSPEASESQLQPVLGELRRSQRISKGLHPVVEDLVAARQMSLGHLGLAFAVRRDTARAAVDRLQKVGADKPAKLRRRLAALLYAGRPKTALTVANSAAAEAQQLSRRVVQQVQKLAADAALFTGDTEPYTDYAREAGKSLPLPGEEQIEELVSGKRVAIVGPADTGDALGETIDGFDLVVRAQYAPQFVSSRRESLGSRTDVAYYSGRDLHAALDKLPGVVESGQLKLVVARPGDYTRHGQLLEAGAAPWLRFYRQECSLYFHGRPLGVPRMVYDLLQFQPAEIGLFNIDLYSGGRWFADGYRAPEQSAFGPGSIMNDLMVVHDLLTDFRFLRALTRAGAVVGYGASQRVLSMTEEEYVFQLEKGGAFA